MNNNIGELPKVQVLLSAYNGEKYLRTQLDSLLAQNYRNLEILVRDDGSTDGTCDILREYADKEALKYFKGPNAGVIGSFFELFHHADPAAAFYALCDQDDKWMPDKISAAVRKLTEMQAHVSESQPVLYCSAQIIADENLKPIPDAVTRTVRKASFGNALVQNICTGCTAVFDRRLLSLLNRADPQQIIMHDWWIYLIGTCFGKVYYDQNAYIFYRQHGTNTFGAMRSKKQLFLYRMKQLTGKRGKIYSLDREFLKVFEDDIPDEKCRMVHELLHAQNSLPGRLRVAFDRRFFRQKKNDDLIFRLIILTGKL